MDIRYHWQFLTDMLNLSDNIFCIYRITRYRQGRNRLHNKLNDVADLPMNGLEVKFRQYYTFHYYYTQLFVYWHLNHVIFAGESLEIRSCHILCSYTSNWFVNIETSTYNKIGTLLM